MLSKRIIKVASVNNKTSLKTLNQPTNQSILRWKLISSSQRYLTTPSSKTMSSSTKEPIKSKNTFKYAAIQMKGSTNKIANLETAFALIKEASSMGAQLISLPECFNSPYGTSYFQEYSEVLEADALEKEMNQNASSAAQVTTSFKYDQFRPTFHMLSEAAKTNGVYLIGGSYPERDASGNLFNTSVVFDPNGNRISTYRKIHLFDIDVPGGIKFKESDALTAGKDIATFKFEGRSSTSPEVTVSCQVGLAICYDMRFPELSQIMAQKHGCKLIVFPAAFNMTTGPVHWALLQQARALDNQVYISTVSPARDTNASYIAYGHSLVVNPWGKIVNELDENPGILITEIDLDYIDQVRSAIPVLNQKRSDLYELSQKNL